MHRRSERRTETGRYDAKASKDVSYGERTTLFGTALVVLVCAPTCCAHRIPIPHSRFHVQRKRVVIGNRAPNRRVAIAPPLRVHWCASRCAVRWSAPNVTTAWVSVTDDVEQAFQTGIRERVANCERSSEILLQGAGNTGNIVTRRDLSELCLDQSVHAAWRCTAQQRRRGKRKRK
jgi:hypothetical protein